MTSGTFALVRNANLKLLDVPASKTPWWWSRIAMMEERIRSIHDAASSDKDGMVAPKEYWVSWKNDELNAFYEERRKLLSQPSTLGD